jgi:low temperature requirement protein LtrA
MSAAGATARVSTIELFFDLVFVFTITQLTHFIAHMHTALDILRALVVLTLIWWMYAGYAWLTNGVGAERRMRIVLIAGMAGFLVLALSIPDVYGRSGLAFGLAYLFVVLLHLGAFYYGGGAGIGRATLRLAPFNLGAALLVLAAGVLETSWDWVFLLAAALVYAIAMLRHAERGFPINAAHFVERHGLVVIIALGETIVAVGVGASGRPFDARTLGAIAIAVLFLSTLWWSYFDRDDARAEHALNATDADTRALLAVRAFWYPYLTMIFGIVWIAAALEALIAKGAADPNAPAWLAAGLAIFLAGSVWFRRVMQITPVGPRVASCFIAMALIWAGRTTGGMLMLGALTFLMMLLLAVERARLRS